MWALEAVCAWQSEFRACGRSPRAAQQTCANNEGQDSIFVSGSVCVFAWFEAVERVGDSDTLLVVDKVRSRYQKHLLHVDVWYQLCRRTG